MTTPDTQTPTLSDAAPHPEVRPGFRFVKRIGWVPDDWRPLKLGQVGNIRSGATPARSQQDRYFEQGETMWVKTMDLNNGPIKSTDESITEAAIAETSCKVLPEGTVLVAMYGGLKQIGRTGILSTEAATNQAISAVEVDRELALPEFVLRWLNFRVVYWRMFAASSRKDPNITGQDVSHFPVALPPLSEQRAIADILGSWDRALADLDALIDAKRRYAKGLAQRLLTGRARLPDFGTDEMKETKIGPVPSDWRELRLGKVFAKRSEKNADSAIDHVITVGKYAIRPQSEHFDKSVASADRSNYNVIRPGDFVYDPMSAYYGAIGRYDADRPGIVSPVYRVLTLRKGFDSGFVRHLLGAHYVRHRIASYSTQGNKEGKRRGLQHSAFTAIPIYAPGQDEQRAIAAVLDAADAERVALTNRRDALARQKKGLMQRLLTGQVRVPASNAVRRLTPPA